MPDPGRIRFVEPDPAISKALRRSKDVVSQANVFKPSNYASRLLG